MDRTELLKKLIIETGLSMRAFSEKAGIPNTTLHSMLERGIGNASVDNVIKICRALNISIEDLESMVTNSNINKKSNELKTIAAHYDGEKFTEEEKESINDFIKYVISKRIK